MLETIEVLPSVLAADFSRLADDLARLEKAGAKGWHVDVMDGHFVPNITMGPAWVEAIRRSSSLFIDVHLMIYNPYEYIEKFVKAGADRITFHIEATEDVDETIHFIRTCDKAVGLAINPETSVELLRPYLAKIDLALIMTVQPGFGGQTFLEETEEKIKYIAALQREAHLMQVSNPSQPLVIQVDGGIDDTWGPRCRSLGANSFVAGTYLFRHKDPKSALALLSQ